MRQILYSWRRAHLKYIDEYRDGDAAQRYAQAITSLVTKPWTLMELCGGQTHSIVKFGVDEMLPKEITLVHGPGCPVCVTPLEMIDKALQIASLPDVIFCSFGDMLRVPGSGRDLLAVKAAGGDVRIARCRRCHPSRRTPRPLISPVSEPASTDLVIRCPLDLRIR